MSKKKILIGILLVIVVLIGITAFASIQTPTPTQELPETVKMAWTVAHPTNWDADAEDDGLRVWFELLDKDEKMIEYQDVDLPVKIEIFTTESKTYPLEPARLVYSSTSKLTDWDHDAFVSGALGIKDIGWNEIGVLSTEQDYGILYVTVTFPDGEQFSARYDPVQIKEPLG